MRLHYHNDFRPLLANLCTPPLLFRRRPPQSNYPSDTVLVLQPVSSKTNEGWYFTGDRSLPPMLHITNFETMPNCSKAPRGLSVLLQVAGIFTGSAISPSPSLRQLPSRYAIRAGQNLPVEEFRSLCYILRWCGSFLPHSACRHTVRTISSRKCESSV